MAAATWSTWGIRAGALLLALLLWLYAVTEHVYSTEVAARLHLADPPVPPGERELVVASSVPEWVSIRVTGRGKDLLRLDEGSYAVHLTPDGRAGSVHVHRLTNDMVEAREDARATVEYVVEPRELDIMLDWRAQRSVPIVGRVQVVPAEPYVIVGSVALEPATVEISGPSTQVRRVEYVATDSVRLVGVEQDVDTYVALEVPAGTRCRLEPSRARLRADVQILAQDDLPQVPVSVRNAPARRYQLEPARVRVRVKGGIEVIARIDPEQDLGLYVDAQEYTGGPLPVRSEGQALFEIVDITPAAVEVVVR